MQVITTSRFNADHTSLTLLKYLVTPGLIVVVIALVQRQNKNARTYVRNKSGNIDRLTHD